jgi:hypothetical protein
MVSKRDLEEGRRRAIADMHQMLGGGSRARSAAARMYPNLTDNLTQSLVKSNWQAERQKPSRRFKRKPFRKRGQAED